MTWHDMTWHDMTWHDITLHYIQIYIYIYIYIHRIIYIYITCIYVTCTQLPGAIRQLRRWPRQRNASRKCRGLRRLRNASAEDVIAYTLLYIWSYFGIFSYPMGKKKWLMDHIQWTICYRYIYTDILVDSNDNISRYLSYDYLCSIGYILHTHTYGLSSYRLFII